MAKALLHLERYCAEDRSTMKAQALSLAAFYRQLSAVRTLLDGNTIAPAAVSHALSFMYTNEFAPPGSCEVVEVLLNHGAEPNTVFRDRPLLHYACWTDDVQLASLLLSHGADVELRDADGKTALHALALMAGSGDIVKVLLEYKLDINARDNDGETAMWTAIAFAQPGEQGSYWRLGTQLLESGASVDQPNKHGETLLHIAASQSRVQVACQLLEAGADVNARDDDGYTAADLLGRWKWDFITEEKRAECEEILERYNFHQSGEKTSVADSDEDLDSDEGLDKDEGLY